MASNRQRAATNRRIWGKLRRLSNNSVHLIDDPLDKHYEVNRFGIRAEHDSMEFLRALRDKLVDDLAKDGWEVVKAPHSLYAMQASRPGYDGYVYIDQPTYKMPSEEVVLKIGVH